ncbi:molybdenum cofactor guanylyltransferase [Bdellovibrionota bacterium FG-2]
MAQGREIVGVVLAGGKSSRMGRPKELLEVSGERFLDRMIARLREVTPEIWVSGAGGIADDCPDLGPLGGVSTVLKRALGEKVPPKALLFVPVDMPQMTKHYFEKMAQALLASEDTLAVHFEGFPLPVALRCEPRVLDCLLRCIADSRLSVQAFLELLGESSNLEALSLQSVERAAFLNVNTPEEFQEYHEHST